MGVNYGADRLRFPAPVLVNSKVRAGAELLALIPLEAGSKVVTRVTVEIDGRAKPACVVETVSLLVP
jgi:acyl dehydratase